MYCALCPSPDRVYPPYHDTEDTIYMLDPHAMRQAREKRKLGRSAAAQQISISLSTLRSLEKGRHQPSLAVAFKLADVYRVKLDDLRKVDV